MSTALPFERGGFDLRLGKGRRGGCHGTDSTSPSAPGTRIAPETSLGRRASRRLARVRDSYPALRALSNSDAATSPNRAASRLGGTTIKNALSAVGGTPLAPARAPHVLDCELSKLGTPGEAIRELIRKRGLWPEDDVLRRAPPDLAVGQEIHIGRLAVLKARCDAGDKRITVCEPHSGPEGSNCNGTRHVPPSGHFGHREIRSGLPFSKGPSRVDLDALRQGRDLPPFGYLPHLGICHPVGEQVGDVSGQARVSTLHLGRTGS